MKKQQTVDQFVWRRRLGFAAVFASALYLSWHAFNIQVLNNDFLRTQGDMRHLRTESINATRGMILDRNGEALAVSTPVASVWANPEKFAPTPAQWSRLSEMLNRPVAELKRQVEKRSNKEFVYLKRHIDPDLANQIDALKIAGVDLQTEYRRYYPSGEVAGHLIGFTNVDDKGQEGLELAFEERLAASTGKRRVIRDNQANTIRTLEMIKAASPGHDVYLSIDRRLQYIAYRELKKAVVANNASSGSLVMLDTVTGEVIAQVNQPAFNPNNRSQFQTENYRNRSVVDVFEPGSTIKPFTIVAALKAGSIATDTMVDTSPGYLRVDDSTIKDVRNFGMLDVPGIIQKSSNVGVTQIALRVPKESMWETLSDFGFGDLTASGFPGESAGVLPFFGTWNRVEQATLSYGYGLSVTALQLAQAYSVLANGGVMKPISYEKVNEAPKGKRVIEESIARNVVKMMEGVVSREGTAYKAAIEGYRVAGKTGTVKKLGADGYTEDKYLATFAGIAPASSPRLAVVVTIDNPGNGDYYGGKIAAPIFSNVVSEALRIMNVPPDNVYTEPLRMTQAGRHL
ncbi:MAG: penicillin-binding transpeptidase domain-containing protein [Gammaproteobacteria bacterium]|nr:penicillin-binding transpeptidase domain-containing protein [Gammaproteobacteria bacterium]